MSTAIVTSDESARAVALTAKLAPAMTETTDIRIAQQEMPFAMVQGQPMLKLPDDLYIPPDALEVFLEAFEGPLDLLLYLIRRQNLDILDIPIAEITRQYTNYIEMMAGMRIELAAEYLVMAAILAEIKSRMLLPRPEPEEEEDEDPRAELIRRLQEYERFKKAAEDLDSLPRIDRDLATASAGIEDAGQVRLPPEVDLREVLLALKDVMARADVLAHHQVQSEPLSVRERMARITHLVSGNQFVEFGDCFDLEEGRLGAVVTFLALLELLREHLVDLVQQELFAPIYVRAPARTDTHASD